MKAKVLISGDGGKYKELIKLTAKCDSMIIIPAEKCETELLNKAVENVTKNKLELERVHYR